MAKQPKNMAQLLTVCLGFFWLLDGILQLQPLMFTHTFITAVLSPALEGQPQLLATIIAFGINLFGSNVFLFNLLSALIQLGIAALLLLPPKNDMRRFGLWLSVAWSLIVWIFGEGFGALATGSASFYTGAPGPVLLYLVIALCLLYHRSEKLPVIAGSMFLFGAMLNMAPMFWQTGMLSMLSSIPSLSHWLGSLNAQQTFIGNFIAIDILAFFGIFLIWMPSRFIAWTAAAFLLVIWGLSQGFGGLQTFPFGTATDPNSAPLLILFMLPLFFAASVTPRNSPQ